MPTLADIQEKFDEKQVKLAQIFEDHKTDDGGFDMTAEMVADVRERNEELAQLGKDLEAARLVDETYQKNREYMREQAKASMHVPVNGTKGNPDAPGGNPSAPAYPGNRGKSLGAQIAEAKEYQQWSRGNTLDLVLDDFDPQDLKHQKALLETGAGFAPETTRTGRVVDYALRTPMVDDMIPQTTTEQAAVVYMEETTFTNAAAETAEGGSYGESALEWTEQSQTIRKIATFLPATDEQLEDVPQMQSLVNNRLAMMIRLRREQQILQGDGLSNNLLGFYNKPSVQTQAVAGDPVPDAILKAMTKVRHTGFANPTAVILHPNDWQDIRLLRTLDGVYIWGSPAEAGPERVWGIQVISTTAATENTGLTGDFDMYSELVFRKGITLKVSDSHSDYFVKGKQAIRADERVALVIYRAAAFCLITGV